MPVRRSVPVMLACAAPALVRRAGEPHKPVEPQRECGAPGRAQPAAYTYPENRDEKPRMARMARIFKHLLPPNAASAE